MRPQILQVILDDPLDGGRDSRAVALQVVELQQQALADVAGGDADRGDLLDQRQHLFDRLDRRFEVAGDRLDRATEVAALVQVLDQPLGDRDLLALQQGADIGEDLLVQASFGGDQRHRVEVVLGDAVGRLLGQDLGVILVVGLGALGLLTDQAGGAERALDHAAADWAGLLLVHLEGRVGKHLLADDFLQFLPGEAEDVVGLDQTRGDPSPHLRAHLHRGFHANAHRVVLPGCLIRRRLRVAPRPRMLCRVTLLRVKTNDRCCRRCDGVESAGSDRRKPVRHSPRVAGQALHAV